MCGTKSTRTKLSQLELKIIVKYSMVLSELSYKSYQSEHKSREITEKSASRRLNKSKSDY